MVASNVILCYWPIISASLMYIFLMTILDQTVIFVTILSVLALLEIFRDNHGGIAVTSCSYKVFIP